ncbi:MAG: AI-2E family transporter [Cytophagaceae bacterium]
MNNLYQLIKKITVYIIFIIVVIYGLVKSQQFLIPLALAVLFTYLLFPIANFLEKRKIPRIISNLVAILIGLGIVTGSIAFISNQLAILASDMPQVREQAVTNIDKVRNWISASFGVSRERLDTGLSDLFLSLMENSGQMFTTLFMATTSTLVNVALMPVFVFFMLYYRTKFHDFVIKMVPNGKNKDAEKVLDEVNSVTVKYMTGVFIVVIILSITHSISFTIIGVEHAILLGVIAAIFNFIPYFGTLIGAIFPLFYTFFVMDSLSYMLWVVIYFLIIQFVENNILTPNITGGQVRLNPLITILSLIFGSMIWGPAGMFLIVPYIAMLRITCEHINYLQPVAFLLSDRGTEKYAITIEKIKNLFSKK